MMTTKNRMSVNIGALELANPVIPASGCFDIELSPFTDLSLLGAIVPKTIFYEPRKGNPSPRTNETIGGMLNSVGIPSKGVDSFLKSNLPDYKNIGPPIIVSIGGLSINSYFDLAERLNEVPEIAAIELNVSCPNLEDGGLEIGSNPKNIAKVVKGVVDRYSKPVITKLTPNVTSITDLAIAAESSGSTAISLINTLGAMGIDNKTKRSATGTLTSGLSGPAIRPIALKMVWQVSQQITIPIIGMGGITNTSTALEFIIAGASAIGVGTVNFTNPNIMVEIIKGLESYVQTMGLNHILDIRGQLMLNSNNP